MVSCRARTWQLIVSKLRWGDIFIPYFSEGQKQLLPRLRFSLCLLLPLLKGEPVMLSCQPPTQTVYYNQCRLCWREKKCMCAGVCTLYVSKACSSLIKVAWAAQVLVTVVCLLRTLRIDVLMKADCTVQYTQLHCWLLLVSSLPKGHLKSALFSCFDLFLLQILLDLSYLWVSHVDSCQLWPVWRCIYVLFKADLLKITLKCHCHISVKRMINVVTHTYTAQLWDWIHFWVLPEAFE